MANPVTGTFSADGDGSTASISGRAMIMIGRDGSENFGSGTVTLEVLSADGTNWGASATTYTAKDVDFVNLGAPGKIRLVLSGSTSPDLYYEIREG